MLKRVIIRDFFSFKGENIIELNAGVNVLLGINGSGKTCFLNALRLFYEGVAGNGFEKLFLNQWGGFYEVVNANGKRAEEIQLTFVFDTKIFEGINNGLILDNEESCYTITISPVGKEGNYTLQESWYKYEWRQMPNIVNAGRLNLSKGFHRELTIRDDANFRFLRSAISEISLYSHFNTANDSPLRRPSMFSADLKLQSSGANLAQLLNTLKNNRTLEYEKIEKILCNINPHYKSIELSYFPGSLYLSLREANLDKTIGALHISDGTLCFLLMMCIFYNPDRGKLIGMDEPESGLHPDMIKSVGDMIKQAAKESQIIVATHSPLLLNLFELGDVLIFEKDRQNNTHVATINEEEFADYEGSKLPGQLWVAGQIGAKRW